MKGPIELPEYAYEHLERYRELLGDEWEQFLEALRRPLPVAAWRNAARVDEAAFENWFRSVEPGVSLERLRWFDRGYRLWASPTEPQRTESHAPEPHSPGPHAPDARRPDPTPGNRAARALGLLHLQEEVSMIPAVILEAKPGEQILDLCGAPGNKTALVASLMEDRGTIVCNDTDIKRLRAGRAAWSRLGFSSISATNHDGGSYPAPVESFDRILVDAPCSGEGTSRRNLSSLRPGPPDYHRMLHGRQRRLLERALQLCRPGGRVVYSTCTYAPEENEMVVADVLARGRTGYHIVAAPARIEGLKSSPGLTRYDGVELGEELANTLRVWPHQNDSGGFFVAVLEKHTHE